VDHAALLAMAKERILRVYEKAPTHLLDITKMALEML